MKSSLGALGAALSLCLFADAALAHATLEVTEASVNSTYKGVMRVPHGCDGLPTPQGAYSHPRRRHCHKAHAKAGVDRGDGQGQIQQNV